MIVVECKQGGETWHGLRCGIPTSSKFSRIITSLGNRSKQLEDAALQMACEKLTGLPSDFFMNKWMERGNRLEPMARAYYEYKNKCTVQEVGTIYRNDERLYSTSTDGLISDGRGLLEIKCPKPSTQAELVIVNEFPKIYTPQVQGELFVTGLDYADFLSYCPGMKPFQVRIEPDLEFHEKLESLIHITLKLRDIYMERLGA